MKSSAPSAAAAGCATTPRPCSSAAARSTSSAGCRWASCWPSFSAGSPTAAERKVAGEVLREIRNRLQFLVDVGLDYLTLARPAPSLSGGEMQRIRLAAQVGSGLCGVLYVLDEPTIGLHPRDNRRLLDALKKLRDLGNTLLLVEHDREVIAQCRPAARFWPGGRAVRRRRSSPRARPPQVRHAPRLGHRAVSVGQEGDPRADQPADGVASSGTDRSAGEGPGVKAERKGRRQERPTAARPHPRPLPGQRPPPPRRLAGNPSAHGTTTSRTSTCGSRWARSPSSPAPAAAARVRWSKTCSTTPWPARCTAPRPSPGAHDAIRGVELVNKVIRVDQQPLGQTPTSNPATFTGVFDLIRTLYAQLPEAKLRGYTPRRFSFNVPGGRCEKCEGNGQLRIEMHFLPDVWVECDTCRGRRYNPETLAVQYHGRSIADVLDMSCGEAVRLFENIPKIRRVLETLCDVGLDYLTLGQPAPTLSGGEAQRVKLAAELSRPDTGRTLYLLDEPTTGLHFDDLAKLLGRAQPAGRSGQHGGGDRAQPRRDQDGRLGDRPGPRGGRRGRLRGGRRHAGRHRRAGRRAGQRTAEGGRSGRPEPRARHATSVHLPPSALRLCFVSHTAEALAPVLAAGPFVERGRSTTSPPPRPPARATATSPRSAATHEMPWEIDGRRWHTVARVGRTGNPCRWDGRILAEVIDRIEQQSDLFSETDWNSRSVVEIRAAKKSDGWFFHAITGEEWLLKMKFRTARGHLPARRAGRDGWT